MSSPARALVLAGLVLAGCARPPVCPADTHPIRDVRTMDMAPAQLPNGMAALIVKRGEIAACVAD